jgi:hypothetical protein
VAWGNERLITSLRVSAITTYKLNFVVRPERGDNDTLVVVLAQYEVIHSVLIQRQR